MKVRELIEALSAFDPEFLVMIPGQAENVEVLDQVLLDWAAPEGGRLQLTYPDEPGQPVVRMVGPDGPGEDYFRNTAVED
ncbi:hypothetical protein LRS10_13880 [Phenylobacterium sp. J426]|uniref:hypothetical protein n=1 Tax=Phenylobacterium sp. J426 TaxID=2898439 RepID=UPI002150C4EA|nr:hypothetical protein [Phenylobacterium sp. J426]MCR5875183.1 hypothetical protein [Phenylobacterium sp. J426]